VEIRNNTNRPIRVTYADFSLTSDRGQRLSAVNPFAASRAFSDYTPATAELLATAVAQVRYTPRPAYVVPRTTTFYRPQPAYIGRPFVNSYQVFPNYLPYRSYPYQYSVLWSPYPSSYLYPPGYWDSVTYWGGWGAYGGYPAPRPPPSVLAMAIPEGVIQPGGSVGGFLYFQEATAQASSLRLVWDAFDAAPTSLPPQPPPAPPGGPQPPAATPGEPPPAPPPPPSPSMVARLMVDFGIVR
jgi:hypothetical protein